MKFFRRLIFLAIIGGLVWIGLFHQAEISRFFFPSPPPGAPTEKPLKFAVMADIHLDTENLKMGVEKAKKDQVEFIIITGDLTSLGKRDELLKIKKVLDDGGIKYYVVPGNHDLWASQQFKANIFREVFGKDFQSFKEDGTKFILVNDGGYGGIRGVRGSEGEGQGEWLEKELEECLQITCLVFMHIPLNHPNSLHVMGEENEKVTEEAKRWVKLFVQEKVKEVFAGHLHYSSSYELDGLRTTVVGAISKDRNLQSPKFLEVLEEAVELEPKEVFVAE